MFNETDRRNNSPPRSRTKSGHGQSWGSGSVPRKPGEDAMHIVHSGKALSGAGGMEFAFVMKCEGVNIHRARKRQSVGPFRSALRGEIQNCGRPLDRSWRVS